MKKIQKLLALSTLAIFGACTMPNNNNLTTPDETAKELQNPTYLRNLYETIKGEYTLQLLNTATNTNRCVVLELDYKTIQDGKNSFGQPILNVVLTGRFTDVDSMIEETLTSRYYKENGDISLFLNNTNTSNPAAPVVSEKTLEVVGNIKDRTLSGTLIVKGFNAGDLTGSLGSNSGCPSRATLREQFSSKIEQMFSGRWEGISESNSDLAGFRSKVSIFVQRIPVAGGFSYDVISLFDREPFGTMKAVPMLLTVALNQTPYIVNLIPPTTTDFPKFYGTLKDEKTIVGQLVYPNGSLQTTFKRKK